MGREEDWRTPDVMLPFSGRFDEDARGYLIAPAFLCIEVLSPSDRQIDLFRKCEQYFACGVPHCWVIDPESKTCFEYHGGKEFILADEAAFLNAGDIQIFVADLFAA